MAYIMTRGYP